MIDSDLVLPKDLPRVFVWDAKGATRMQFTGADRISEVFDKAFAPLTGDLGVVFWQDAEKGGELVAVGLGIVRGVAGVASGAVRASIAPLMVLNARIAVSEILASEILAGMEFEIPPTFRSRTLPPAVARALLRMLAQSDPTVVRWVRSATNSRRGFPERVRQARDAVRLAAGIAEVELPSDAFQSVQALRANETLLETVINSGYQYDLEEELLPLDLQRFDGKLRPRQVAASMSIFEDSFGAKKLTVFSVNKKPIEEELGVDLLYWDHAHDAFTFVQYKRLEAIKSDVVGGRRDWVYKKKSELKKQLDLMPNGRSAPRMGADWRATQTPFWFKFVRGDAGAHLDEKVLKGMYVAADWLRLAVADGSLATGPRGGFRVSYSNAKYLGRAAFVQLVSRGFVGTTSARSMDFKKVLPGLGRDRELIIAVKQSWR